MSRSLSGNSLKNKNKYVPGDITSFINQHPNKSALYTRQDTQDKTEKIKNGTTSLTADMYKINLEPIQSPDISQPSKSSSRKLLEARAKTAFAAAYYNFQTARKMAQENLDHQPLPDAILDKGFLTLQGQGDPNPGLGLDVQPISTGIGYKGYKVGATQCTKLKVYRPKTCGVIPKHLDKSTMHDDQPIKLDPKIGQMDLAIGWEYRPRKSREPKLPKHIDGSNDPVPGIFTLVKPIPQKENLLQFERAEGVFHNTQGEIDFFDRDLILKRKDYLNKYEKERDCTCGTSVASFQNVPGSESINRKNRPKTTKSDSMLFVKDGSGRLRCKSSPNLSMIANPTDKLQEHPVSITASDIANANRKIPVHQLPKETNEQKKAVRQPRYAHQTIPRMCHQMRQDYEKMMKKYFLTQELMKLDENNNCPAISAPVQTKQKPVVYIPRPKQPYKKKNYHIDSLAPPFSSWTGLAGQSEYPNHWRLASIYQHAYKPKFILCLFFIVYQKCGVFVLSQQQNQKISPCPNVFSYGNNQDDDAVDVWYGTLRLQTSVLLHGISVDVIFDRRVAVFGAYYFNDVTTKNNLEFLIENKTYKLEPGQILTINIYVRYDSYVPSIKQVRLNGQNICVELPRSTTSVSQHAGSNRDDVEYPAVQPIHDFLRPNNNQNTQNIFNQNPQTTTTTKRTTRRDNSGRGNSGNASPGNSGNKNPHNIANNNPQYTGNSDTQNTGINNPSTTGNRNIDSNGGSINSNNNNNNNNENTFGFIGDSFTGNDENSFGSNTNVVTQRPFIGSQTTTPYYQNNNRATPLTSRPNRDTTTRKSTYFQGDLPFLNSGQQGSSETSTHSILSTEGECGVVISKSTPLIVHGEETYAGQFPWHSAIYLSDVGQLKYICGGSLISLSAIITAAHCVTHAKTSRAINNNNLLIYLGKNNLQKWTGPEQDAKVAEIVVHPDYDSERFYSDLAVLKLKDSVTRSNYIRPVCLWNFDSDLKMIVGKLGSIPGWGYNENGLVSEDLTFIRMPIVTHETCIWSNRDFFSKVTSDKAFCAGFRNGSSVCNGDSGGGMVLKQGKQFFLRGIVSISIALQNTLRCDPTNYAVFVDAAKFTNWIKTHL
ncbi:unnamed protein product [Diamesa hyperborea]